MPTQNRTDLDCVTLVAITSVARDATLKSMLRSLDQARFKKALFLSDEPPPVSLNCEIEWRRIMPMRSKEDYSNFVLRRLNDHVETSHALITQWDSFILNGAAWDDQFLNYDYVGAPWPHFSDHNNVGNGGFSLRSKRLLQACVNLPEMPGEAEDVQICRIFREHLELRHGLKFAPETIAREFAFERSARLGTEFGFHGVFNMIDIISPAEFNGLLASLEAGVIGRIDQREILIKAFRCRNWSILLQALTGQLKRA